MCKKYETSQPPHPQMLSPTSISPLTFRKRSADSRSSKSLTTKDEGEESCDSAASGFCCAYMA